MCAVRSLRLAVDPTNQPTKATHIHSLVQHPRFIQQRRAIWLLFIFRRECFEWAVWCARRLMFAQHHQNNLLSGRARRWIKVVHGLG